MRFSTLVTLAATAQAQHIGFNYGSTFTDGSAKQQSDFEAEFNKAKSLAGTNGEFTSARLYTMIQGGSTDTPISAIPAAMDTKTNLLLGLWASAGQADFSNEITALTSAINQYGTAFTSLIDGISVGSEDLYRNSPTGIENDSGVGANPDTLVDYIKQVRSAIAGTTASGASVGHVDTWTAWVNGSNAAVITACDWVGMDAYPYFQTTMDNSIGNAKSTFFQAYDNTVSVAQGKEVWVTETGWPVSGPVENQAVASIANAETYWKEVACTLFGQTNTWWYTLQDAEPTTPSPSFGIVGSDLDSAPLYDLSCNGSTTVSSSSSISSSTVTASSSAASPTAPASASGSNTESLSQATPGPESSPTVTPVVSSGGTFTTRMTTMITVTTCPSACTSGSAVATQPASEPATTASSTSPSAVSPQGSCPANLNGQYQFPHLIVPVNSSNPTAAYGTQYDGTITPTVSSIFNFDIPASYAGMTCSLLFLFPEQAALQTASYTFNGQGGLNVNELASPATEQTTFDSVPQTSVAGIGSIPDLKMGNSYVVANQACAVGDRIAFEFESIGGLALEFFNDDGPSPLGVFMAAC